jgi:putative endonuclease
MKQDGRPQPRRQVAERFGQAAEALAAVWLRLKGYRIVARQVRTPVGEVDIIARRGGVLAFVEVKARTELAMAADIISPRQRRRIVRAAQAFVARSPAHARLQPRFDVVLVAPRRWPRHIADAFRSDD